MSTDTTVTARDWSRLQSLAERIGQPPERIVSVRRRADLVSDGRERTGAPFVLLTGRESGGLEMVLNRFISKEAVKALSKSGNQPVVIGREPELVQPTIGKWETLKIRRWPAEAGHLIVLRTEKRPSASLISQLSSLGYIDQMVLVTRLSMPLHADERTIIESLTSIVSSARIAIVGIKGDELTDDELSELPVYAASIVANNGFQNRYGGSAVWYATGASPRLAVDDEEMLTFLRPDIAEVQQSAPHMISHGLTETFRKFHLVIADSPELDNQYRSAVNQDDVNELGDQLANYISNIARDLNRYTDQKPDATTDQVRQLARQAFGNWESYMTPGGFWLQRVEKLRPGMQSAFLSEVKSSLTKVRYVPDLNVLASQPDSVHRSDNTILKELVYSGAGLVAGIAATLLVRSLLDELSSIIVTIVSVVALIIAFALTYIVSKRSVLLIERNRRYATLKKKAAERNEELETPGLRGWSEFQQHITGWFRTTMQARMRTPEEELQNLSHTFNIRNYK